jgi:hypothetical protein
VRTKRSAIVFAFGARTGVFTISVPSLAFFPPASLPTAGLGLRDARPVLSLVDGGRVYDLRHTFATFALRAGISTFDLSRYMGASLTMIDRHYGHLARDGREHAIRLLDGYADFKAADVQAMDVRWTPQPPIVADKDNGNSV